MGAKKNKSSSSPTVITRTGSSGKSFSLFLNFVKWVLIVAVISAGVVANTFFADVPWALRAAAGIVVVIAALTLFYFTSQGVVVAGFVKQARSELRKVVWPTQQEVVQTTLMVAAMVLLTALVLWGIDALFLWGVGWLVGQRG